MGERSIFRDPRVLLAPAVFIGCFHPLLLPAGGVPRPDHVVIVVEENHSYPKIIGEEDAPYLNSLARTGALFTASYAIEHPSQPNYLDLFSGSNQRVDDDSC